MTHHKATEKKLRQDKVLRVRNKSTKARIRTETKKAFSSIETATPEDAKKVVKVAGSVIDKAGQRRIIPKNRASRKKSRLARELNKKSAQ